MFFPDVGCRCHWPWRGSHFVLRKTVRVHCFAKPKVLLFGKTFRICSWRVETPKLVWELQKWGDFKWLSERYHKSAVSFTYVTRLYEGHSQIIDTPSQTKTKDLFINLRFNYSQVFSVGLGSFFRPFQQTPEERKKKGKSELLKGASTCALAPW